MIQRTQARPKHLRLSAMVAGMALSLVAMVATGSPAHAAAGAQPEAEAEDEIQLKDGSFVRGRVVAFEREKSVTMVVAGSQQRRVIPWGEIAELRRGNVPPPEPSEPEPTPTRTHSTPAASPPQRARRGAPHVYLDVPSGRSVTLYEVSQKSEWGDAAVGVGTDARRTTLEPLCTAPCARIIDGRKGQRFVIGGARLSPSKSFTLLERQGQLSLRVKPRSQSIRIGAWIATPLGLLLAPAGLLMITNPFRDADDDAVDPDLRTGGYAVLGVASATVVAGVVLAILSRTRVRFGDRR
ncbi:MAG: hypothetical protein V3V08_13310 [Nannocystaceae bacterium]